MSHPYRPFLSQVALVAFAVISFGCQRPEPQSNKELGIAHGLKVAVQEPPASMAESQEASHSSQANSAIMINDARVLMETGRVNEAKSKLKEVLRNDPEARAAYYYLTLIEERSIGERNQIGQRNRIILTGAPETPRLGDRPLPKFEPKWEALREVPQTGNIYRWENKHYRSPAP